MMIQNSQAVVIGGGATGVGILRDLSMRGVSAVLFEQGGLAYGTSSRFHGLLHSGARYAVKDEKAAKECIEENLLLRKVAAPCVEETEGFFVLTNQDDPTYEPIWHAACLAAGIAAEQIDVKEALALEPSLSPDIRSVYRVPDCGVDGFRLVWHNAMSARQYGGEMYTHHTVTEILSTNGKITGVKVRANQTGEIYTVACDFVVNASGPWAGNIAHMAGMQVNVTPDRGTLVVFNHLFTSRIINRLHPSGDGDIFVPHGSVTILGTTSTTADSPDDTTPTTKEILQLLDLGEPLFPKVKQYRILRAFAGNRPLYTPPNSEQGRGASRNFIIIDHEPEGLRGFASVFGGKITTYRLMAEKMADLACTKLGITTPCRTRTEPLIPVPAPGLMARAKKFFPANGATFVANRTGLEFASVVEHLEKNSQGREILCECELVTRAEVEVVAKDTTTHSLNDIRLRTRLGMGTCQGTFCSLRTAGVLEKDARLTTVLQGQLGRHKSMCSFLEKRWQGLRPALWGSQLQEVELGRAIFAGSLNLGETEK